MSANRNVFLKNQKLFSLCFTEKETIIIQKISSFELLIF